MGRGWVAPGCGRVAGERRVGERCPLVATEKATPAAEQKTDFASEGFLGPERSGASLSFARQRSEFF